MPAPPGNLRQTRVFWNCGDSKFKCCALLAIFQGAHRSAIYTWLSKFCTYMGLLQNYAGSELKSYKIRSIKMFLTLDKAKPNIENVRGLKLRGGRAYDSSNVW